MRRLLVLAFLVAGCAGATASPSPAERSTPPIPSPSTAARLTIPPLDPDACELGIDAGDAFESKLIDLGDAILSDDPAEIDRVVDETVDVAEELKDSIVWGEEPRHPAMQRLVDAFAAVDEARLAHLTGDSTPFIDAVGEVAFAGKALVQVCA